MANFYTQISVVILHIELSPWSEKELRETIENRQIWSGDFYHLVYKDLYHTITLKVEVFKR